MTLLPGEGSGVTLVRADVTQYMGLPEAFDGRCDSALCDQELNIVLEKARLFVQTDTACLNAELIPGGTVGRNYT